MSEPQKDEFAELSGDQEDTVREARKWVQSMVREAKKSDLHLPMVGIEMMTQGLVILTGMEIEKARADVMAMFREGEDGKLVLPQVQVRQSSEGSG